jgi:hypothetical protein
LYHTVRTTLQICLYRAALLLCIALPVHALAEDVPLRCFDSEPASEAASKRAAAPNQRKRHPAPATDAIQAAQSSSSMVTIHGAVCYNDRRTDGLLAARRASWAAFAAQKASSLSTFHRRRSDDPRFDENAQFSPAQPQHTAEDLNIVLADERSAAGNAPGRLAI